MILYWYEKNHGRIANGYSTGPSINDLLWDENQNVLTDIYGSFYVKVNAELYSKYFVKNSLKTFNYPGNYDLKCYYDQFTSYYKTYTVTVTDCKSFYYCFYSYNHY